MPPMSLLLALAGCLSAQAPESPGCVGCHGSDGNPAPPSALGGIDDPASIGVGAHAAHLGETSIASPVACTECHLFPATVDAPGHIDTPWPAEVPWGPLAATDEGAEPWSHTDATCTVYCHGSTLTGGTNVTPSWTGGAGEATCGSCHGMPPPAPHPAGGECGLCHAPAASGAGLGDPALHIDGILQLSLGTDTSDTGVTAQTCFDCHGTEDTEGAPPPDTQGNTEPTVTAVGAHDTHRTGGQFSAAVACADCHVVPAATGDAGHLDPAPAEVVFSGVATDRNETPTWDGTTCADSYCHSTFPGGSVPAPSWSTVDGSQGACGTCHGNPPPAPPHSPGDTECSDCHPTVAGPGQTIIAPELHCDGSVQL